MESLYGLKQAPRGWYQTLSAFLESIGFSKLIKERYGFRRAVDNITYYIAAYVDDLLIIVPTPALIYVLKSSLDRKSSMTDLGEFKYATKVLDRFSDYISYLIATPGDKNVKLSVSSQPDSEAEKDVMEDIPYRKRVGSIMYLMVGTRPDMAFYIREGNQLLANTNMELVRDLKYFSGTEDYGLLLRGSSDITSSNRADCLTCSYSVYANCADTRRSDGGFVTMLANSSISRLSGKHHTVVLSTTEAEYIVLCHCMQEMMFSKLVRELGFTTTQANLIDEKIKAASKSATIPNCMEGQNTFTYKTLLTKKSKLHQNKQQSRTAWKVKTHSQWREFTVAYCNTKDMVADIFTIALGKSRF
ncbi:hypothetical protein PHMEG_00011356 [Phytophthora megakarya]|uniref:Reverse transcriptase Ty1/copia-type domain-containing protein n=1 Tax=Phytophthora megakarya TaxID=4795 RepID=A0A225WBH2_9STRA|nr:hypothetical protein PHMEG_00011356 [Phytophthora megakarya]